MIDIKEHARNLIAEFYMCAHAKPKSETVIDIQLEKDSVEKWVKHLAKQINWGEEHDIAEACHQVESRLRTLKENLVIEVLKNGAV